MRPPLCFFSCAQQYSTVHHLRDKIDHLHVCLQNESSQLHEARATLPLQRRRRCGCETAAAISAADATLLLSTRSTIALLAAAQAES